MIPTSGQCSHKIEPEYLGPLGDRPLAETAPSGSPADLFPGASAFLSARHQRRRREQWSAARPLAERLLRAEEHVLYVAHAMQMPPALHLLALGAMALPYHQVMLIFSDTRLIEVLLGVRGKSAGTRVRSFPWTGVRKMKSSFGKVLLTQADGKKQTWKVPLRGDRKLLKLLLPRFDSRFLQEGAAATQKLPLWHCPRCGATVPSNPRSCDACRTSFRSPRLAALLSLAFPGAGLFYAGHPFLATADFLGEVLFFMIFMLMLLDTEPGKVMAAVGFGAFLFLLTKIESVHLSHILVARSKPDSQSRQLGYRRFALIGGLASLLLIGGAFPLAGAARPILDRDLDIVGKDSGWQCTRKVGEWDAFADNAFARSQCRHPSGLVVTLLAYPQGMLDSVGDFRADFTQGIRAQGVTMVKCDEELPLPFHGFRFVGVGKRQDGQSVSHIHYFILDEQNRDIHQVVTAVIGENASSAEDLLRDLLAHARWVDSTPPDRTAHSPGG